MRWTPHLLIVSGLLLVVYAWMSMTAGVVSEGLDLSIRNHARTLSERMTTEELSRLFETPPPAENRAEWLEKCLSRYWSRSLRSYVGQTVMLSAGLGFLFILWGIAERFARRKPQPS